MCREEQSPTEALTADEAGKKFWKIQILAAGSPIPAGSPQLKGLPDVTYYKEGGLLKYTTGSYTSAKDARKALAKVRKSFPEAFIVIMQDGKRVGMEK